jgi:Flp pilus assembly protein TadD
MRSHRLLTWFVYFFLATAALAQAPDDRYLRIYSMIQQADQLNSSGQSREAITRFLEAQVALKELQQLQPNWNPRIVAFRQEYISAKLAALTDTKEGAAGPVSNEEKKGNPLDELQSEIAKLANQNAYLEARLKEALKVQPAASDPRELSRAEERIKALQKERDLLAVTLEQTRQKQPPGASPAAKAAAEQQQLVTQNAVADVLRQQNEELQKKIADLQTRLQTGTGRDGERLQLKEAIAALQASNRVMKAEQVAMENRLLQMVRSFDTGSREREKEWEAKLAEARAAAEGARKERDELVKRLNSVTTQLNQNTDKPSTAATADLERQLEAIRAKLQIFEAKSLPYSQEELALFKQAPVKIAAEPVPVPSATNTVAAARKRPELPTGAQPLLRDAERAIDAGRFDEAEKKLRDILRQDDKQPYVLAKLAAVQMDQEKTVDAEASLKKALEIDPQDPACLYLMGSLKVRQEKFDDAVDLLSQAVKIVPDNAQAHFFLSKALIQKGQRKTAETELRKAITLKPGWGEAHYLLAVIYATQEPTFKGLAQYHYKKAIAGGAPRNPDLERWMEKTTTGMK